MGFVQTFAGFGVMSVALCGMGALGRGFRHLTGSFAEHKRVLDATHSHNEHGYLPTLTQRALDTEVAGVCFNPVRNPKRVVTLD